VNLEEHQNDDKVGEQVGEFMLVFDQFCTINHINWNVIIQPRNWAQDHHKALKDEEKGDFVLSHLSLRQDLLLGVLDNFFAHFRGFAFLHFHERVDHGHHIEGLVRLFHELLQNIVLRPLVLVVTPHNDAEQTR
jgi:hypothetical protein